MDSVRDAAAAAETVARAPVFGRRYARMPVSALLGTTALLWSAGLCLAQPMTQAPVALVALGAVTDPSGGADGAGSGVVQPSAAVTSPGSAVTPAAVTPLPPSATPAAASPDTTTAAAVEPPPAAPPEQFSSPPSGPPQQLPLPADPKRIPSNEEKEAGAQYVAALMAQDRSARGVGG